MDRKYDVIIFFSKNLHFSRPRVAIFVGIIKIVTFLLKDPLKTQEKLVELDIIHLNEIYIRIS